MSIGVFKKISSYLAYRSGGFSYGPNKNGVGVTVSEAMAKNFGLPERDISERSFDEFITASVGGVNGRKTRSGEDLLFLRHDGKYSLITYEPASAGLRGYLHEKKGKPSKECLPLSVLPNFERLCANALVRAGDLFAVARITPRENFGADYDYACIAEFFDLLRERTERPSVLWIGGRSYVIILKPEEKEIFSKICQAKIELEGRAVGLSVSTAIIPPNETSADQVQKLAFCAYKLSRGVLGGEYIFDKSEFYSYRNYSKKSRLENEIDAVELVFLPVVSVKSGNVKYFYVMPKDDNLPEKAIFGGMAKELDEAVIGKLSDMLLKGELPIASYCLPVFEKEPNKDMVKRIAELSKSKLYLEIRTRVSRPEPDLEKRVRALNKSGVGTVLFDPEISCDDFSEIRRAGFGTVKIASKDRSLISACSDFCRMYVMDCAVTDVSEESDFIELRRLGVDLCEGEIFSPPTSHPEKGFFSQPHILCDIEEQTVETDDVLYAALSSSCERLEGTEPLEKADKLTILEPTERLEYTEGIGAKKKRRELKLDFAKRRRQKKEIKKGRLKKLKKLKLEKRK